MILLSGIPTLVAAALAVPRNAGCTNRYFARESLSWYTSSFTLLVGFAGEMYPPALMTAWMTTGNLWSGLLSIKVTIKARTTHQCHFMPP
ncbi:hypothetical protein BJ741DRAFT_621408 [Chytriomyces cf. hyalinus JEL632]|nr:hypothetical protein BJ741DRAFT_621408 [Chytriomyces cf. hyalinus JEL632]